MATIINASTSAGLVQTADTSGNLNIQSGGSTKIAVTSAGVAVTGLSKASLPTGSVLQVVSANYSTSVTTATGAYADTGLTATITPTSATSKILVLVIQTLSPITVGSNTYGGWRVLRGATGIYVDDRIDMYAQYRHSDYSCSVLDTPATTSATVYKAQMYTSNVSYTLEAQSASLRTSSITLMEIAA